jgi:hypothetical protein
MFFVHTVLFVLKFLDGIVLVICIKIAKQKVGEQSAQMYFACQSDGTWVVGNCPTCLNEQRSITSGEGCVGQFADQQSAVISSESTFCRIVIFAPLGKLSPGNAEHPGH